MFDNLFRRFEVCEHFEAFESPGFELLSLKVKLKLNLVTDRTGFKTSNYSIARSLSQAHMEESI